MPIVTAEHVFELNVDDLWTWLGDFGDTGKWSGRPPEACVQEGEGIGALRTLTIQDGRVIIDRLEAQTDYSYTYSVVTGPLPYESYKATMAVEPFGDTRARFTWTGEFTPKGMTDEECVAFTENVYAMGIEMMKATIGTLEHKARDMLNTPKKIALQYLSYAYSGRVSEAVDMLSDDAIWTVMGTSEKVPVFGRHDRQATEAILTRTLMLFPKGMAYEVVSTTSEDDRVSIEVKGEAELPNGATYSNVYHLLFRVKDGKVTEIRDYLDTLRAAELSAMADSLRGN